MLVCFTVFQKFLKRQYFLLENQVSRPMLCEQTFLYLAFQETGKWILASQTLP